MSSIEFPVLGLSAQDNFYAGIGATALDGSNNSEEGSIDFHVRNGISTTETLTSLPNRFSTICFPSS